MSFISKNIYLGWQEKLKSENGFRYFWQFWSNYSFALFVPSFIFLALRSDRLLIFHTMALAFVLSRIVLVPIICAFYKKVRPYQKYGFEPITSHFFSERTTEHNSFPSRHIAAFAPVVVVAYVVAPAIGIWMILVTFMTAIARVVLGYHYPSDLLGGAVLGVATAFMALSVLYFPLFT